MKVPWRDLRLTTVFEDDGRGRPVLFRTGVSVSFLSLRNVEKAPKAPARGGLDPYGQHIEPAGRYLQLADRQSKAMGSWVIAPITFKNPIVIEHVVTSAAPEGWKARLSRAFGGKTGKALSKAIAAAGFDAVVTVDGAGTPQRPRHTSEMIDLTMFMLPGRDVGRATGRVQASNDVEVTVKLLPLSPVGSAFIETEIVERYDDDLERRERPEFATAAAIVGEYLTRSRGRDLAVIPHLDEMLIEVLNALDDAIVYKRTEKEFGLDGRAARALHKVGAAIYSKVLRELRK